ncbi:MAG: hypothetical protein ACK2U9_18245, partial [Anaerolineae bacterium]
ARGEILLTSGTRLRAQEIGLLAALGFDPVPVYRRPVVAILSTGDELVPNPKFAWNQAVTIRAPAAEVWPWLVQIGSQRGGWYSWDGIHRLMGIAGSVGNERGSADQIIPELQDLAVGDLIRMVPEEMGMPGYAVVSIEPERALVTFIDGENPTSWVWILEPIDAGTTRLIARYRQAWAPGLANTLGFAFADEMGSLLMQPKTLTGIKQRAEAAAGRRRQNEA